MTHVVLNIFTITKLAKCKQFHLVLLNVAFPPLKLKETQYIWEYSIFKSGQTKVDCTKSSPISQRGLSLMYTDKGTFKVTVLESCIRLLLFTFFFLFFPHLLSSIHLVLRVFPWWLGTRSGWTYRGYGTTVHILLKCGRVNRSSPSHCNNGPLD